MPYSFIVLGAAFSLTKTKKDILNHNK
jgi:hypothetical protein